MSRTISIKSAMEKAFDKILPIPKTPRTYHAPPPDRPLSWVPHGTIGNGDYEERLESFANEVLHIESQITSRIKYGSRGWCYLLEGLGKIDKGEFGACQKAINDCRKLGYLPIDFVAEDQDETRHFKGIHIASEPDVELSDLKEDVETMLRDLPSKTTDYWIGEEYYVMMCVEKGDLINLFKPICDKYHVPLVSSKGWAPILLRSHIANLSKKAEANGLKPVLLLFYDLDPAGIKISDTFKENLEDCEGGTGWNPEGLIIGRFGLNAGDIEQYGLMWIDNLKTSSGRTSRDYGYINIYGNRKCEANALFKNDDTLKAGEEICRVAIEKYYGADALERFRLKEEVSREKLKDVYANPVWKTVKDSLDTIINELGSTEKAAKPHKEFEVETETIVYVDGESYGLCPKCNEVFRYRQKDYGKLRKCRGCHLLMRLEFKKAAEKEVVIYATWPEMGECPRCHQKFMYDKSYNDVLCGCPNCHLPFRLKIIELKNENAEEKQTSNPHEFNMKGTLEQKILKDAEKNANKMIKQFLKNQQKREDTDQNPNSTEDIKKDEWIEDRLLHFLANRPL